MKNKLLLSVMLAVIALGAQWIVRDSHAEEKIEVRVESLKLNTINESLIFKGVIFPKDNTTLYTDTPTVINSILVKEGHEVKKGDPLLKFSDAVRNDLERELEIVNLDINNRRLQLSDLRSGSTRLQLKEGELEQKSLNEEIKSLQRSVEIVSFETKNLNKQAKVMNELLQKKGVSSVEANAAKALAERSQNELADLKMALNLSKQRYELSVSSYQRLKRELQLNENTIMGEYQKLLLQKSNLERQLTEIMGPLKAPFDGVITEIAHQTSGETRQPWHIWHLEPGLKLLNPGQGVR